MPQCKLYHAPRSKSHFIYELLQNAEDALARRRQEEPDGDFSGGVTFRLYKDHLEVSHYGRLFDEDDVRAISDVLRGTKNERLDQIGTFGIGFKSVYAFTRSPEVHTGDEHFVIEHFIRPRAIEPRPLEHSTQTLFYFPFDHPEFGAESAFDLIEAKLKSLGPRSLLFLHHVKELQWTVDGAGEGMYLRETHASVNGGESVEILGEGTGRDDAAEEWLVVQRDVCHPSRPEKLPVKIAYSVRSQREGKSIHPLSQSPLTAYFPTAKETGLGFLIHGPFASTPARDNIQSESSWNNLLLSELATLVADSLEICQRHGFLTVDFLATLPIDADKFPAGSPFRPIYDAVLNAFQTKPLIPIASGGHANATQVVLGRSQELRELLTGPVLHELLGEGSQVRAWVDPAVTENRPPRVWQYLRDACSISVIDGETFARYLTPDFLNRKPDEWMLQFYAFLAGQDALWRPGGPTGHPQEGPLRTKCILRCEDGAHVAPYDSKGNANVFVPVNTDADYPVIKRSLYADEKAQAFFARLGIRERDEVDDVIEGILPKYMSTDTQHDSDTYVSDVRRILRALKTDSQKKRQRLLEAARSTPFVKAIGASGQGAFTTPCQVYMPSEHLGIYFRENTAAWFLDASTLPDETVGDDGWMELGAATTPRIIETDGEGCSAVVHEYTRYKTECTNYELDGLAPALQNRNELSCEEMKGFAVALWEVLQETVQKKPSCLKGEYKWFYHTWHSKTIESSFVVRLKEAAWVPTSCGDFRQPRQILVSEINACLKTDAVLVDLLGFKTDPAINEVQAAERLALAGFPIAVAELLAKNRDKITADAIESMLKAQDASPVNQPEFPERPLINPERRAAKVDERTRAADPKEYDRRPRSVRASGPVVDPSIWLREQYTNNQDIMVCQLCCKAMPFRLPNNGAYYFEAVQISNELIREEHTTYLALCPLCAAMYKVLVKTDKDRVATFIQDILKCDELTVPVQSAVGPLAIRFVATHLHDLKHALPNCTGLATSSSNVE